EEYGVPMAMHFAGTSVCCMANVHCAAATQNFLALEHHSLDVSWWSSLVQEGIKNPIVKHGWIEVPDRFGLGVTLNEDVVRQHLALGIGYFELTLQWDHERSWDRLWSLNDFCDGSRIDPCRLIRASSAKVFLNHFCG